MNRLAPLLVLTVPQALAGQSAPLSLPEAERIALARNHYVIAARAKADEAVAVQRGGASNYYPRLTAEVNYWHVSALEGVILPAGSIGPGLPPINTTIDQGAENLFFTTLRLGQPITQLFKIRQSVEAAAADARAQGAKARITELDVVYGVRQAFLSVLAREPARQAAEKRVEAAEAKLADAEGGAEAGKALDVTVIEARAALLDARQNLLAVENDLADLRATLNNVLGVPSDTVLTLLAPPPISAKPDGAPVYVARAMESSPQIVEASQLMDKVSFGLGAARTAYLPDLSIFGQHVYQNSVPFLPENNLTFGVQFEWTLVDFGERKQKIRERQAQRIEAQQSLEQTSAQVRTEVEKAYRTLTRALAMVLAAREAAALRAEAARLTADRVAVGLSTQTDLVLAEAAKVGAAADLAQAEAGYYLAWSGLERAVGVPLP